MGHHRLNRRIASEPVSVAVTLFGLTRRYLAAGVAFQFFFDGHFVSTKLAHVVRDSILKIHLPIECRRFGGRCGVILDYKSFVGGVTILNPGTGMK